MCRMPVPGGHGLVARSLLREDAYRAIRDAIVEGTLAPGERLNDQDLVEWLGVSRTPVREALARLEQAGLVRTKPGRYTMVSPLDVRAIRNAHSVTAAMHELAVREALPGLSPAELDERSIDRTLIFAARPRPERAALVAAWAAHRARWGLPAPRHAATQDHARTWAGSPPGGVASVQLELDLSRV